MSFIHEDGSETSWTDHMVPESEEFGWVIKENLNVEFDDDFIRHLDPAERQRVCCILTARENGEAILKIDHNYAMADSLMAIFGFHRVGQKDIIVEPTKEGSMDPMNANMLPEAETADIEAEFASLISSNGTTTTLDVKNSLRSKGFWVDQLAVSKAIWNFIINQKPKYQFDYIAGHRVYFEASAKQIIGSTLGSVGSGYIPAACSFKAKKTPAIGDWEVRLADGLGPRALGIPFFGVTRNKARYAYSKQYGVGYVDTIAKKIG